MTRNNKTGVIFFPAFDWAISPTHPEREERLLYTRDQIFEEGVLDLPQVEELTPRLSTIHDIARVHFCVPRVQSQITEAHLIASGSPLVLADKIRLRELKNGFAIVRPPGHHAMRVVHGNRGFCNINNEAILVEYLRRNYGLKKIAIVDSDVHHGDGTQDIFYHDPDLLFISFHQDGRTIYPGTGFTNELGGPSAYAKTLNVPLPPGSGNETMHYVLDNLILPILKEFQPEFVINSAGQDCHYSDPLGSLNFSSQGYAEFTRKLRPDLAVLEGGYAIETALPYLNLAILMALAGEDYRNVREPDYNPNKHREKPENAARVAKVVKEITQAWQDRDRFDPDMFFGRDKFFRRPKSIFYDTDYVEEEQTESLRRCGDCPGYLTIESRSLHNYGEDVQIFAVSIPFGACANCQAEGYEAYEYAKKYSRQYDYLYLQDKSMDTCKAFERFNNQEWVSEGPKAGDADV